MVFLKNNTEFTIKVTVEPDVKYNCILESFKFPSCKGWAGCECTGKIDLCPEVLNQEIQVGPKKTEEIFNTGCNYRISIKYQIMKTRYQTSYVCFIPFEEEVNDYEYIDYGMHRSYNKKTQYITFDLTNSEIKTAMAHEVVGCGCVPKPANQENEKSKSRSFLIEE